MTSTQLSVLPPPEVKVVVVGDGAVGKTCLCNVFVAREFPDAYEPTIFENHTQKMTIEGTEVVLQLWDTAGQEGFEQIRVLSYENTDCFVVCFSVVDLVTFNNLSVWLNELRGQVAKAKVLLVGTKADLRKSAGSQNQDTRASVRFKEVSMKKIRRFVRAEKLDGYVETSAKNGGPEVDRVFHEAIRIALGIRSPDENDTRKSALIKFQEKHDFFCTII